MGAGVCSVRLVHEPVHRFMHTGEQCNVTTPERTIPSLPTPSVFAGTVYLAIYTIGIAAFSPPKKLRDMGFCV